MKVWFVHKYWLEHLVVILVKTKMKRNWFIVVQSSLTYIHYLDQPSQGFNQSTKNPSENKTNFTCKLQGELTQAQSLTNPKSYQTLVQRKDRNEKYVLITNWSDYTSFSSLQITSLKDRENMFLKLLRERDYDLIDFRS